ncbi:hypothetical protein SteCoe_14909 [Stentor coeruleus]|uniref:Uncharacterized protein n=1 Tax=Stentor coeruleus TaxID=5963 RepID=A0A1R2C4Y4_9CILI|nr:hypothetical protein SteCoe_14909 [Stentor coeruleus]
MIEYVVGIGECIGFIALSIFPSVSAASILLLLSLQFFNNKPWEVPSSLFKAEILSKVLFGGLIKSIVVFLTIYLASTSPIL